MKIEYKQEPSGKCPVQAEGKINGMPFYFRSRGGNWSLSISKTKRGNPLNYEKCYVHREPYNGIHRDEPEDFQGHKVQFGAGYAEPDECRAFIERAAGIILPNAQAQR
jgi:hypothetical protein